MWKNNKICFENDKNVGIITIINGGLSMTQVSKNSMDLVVKKTGESVKGKFALAFIGTLIAFGPLVLLSVLVPYFIGVAISILAFGVIETGYIRFMREVLAGNKPKLSLIYSEVKHCWGKLFIGTICLLMFIGGTILLIIPGVVLYGYYAMSLFVAEKENRNDLKGTLKATREKMKNNIVTMYSYKLFYWVFYVILFGLILVSYFGIVALADKNIVLAVLIGIVAVLVLLIVFSILTLYYHTSNEIFFNEMLYYDEKRKATSKKVKVVAEQPETKEVVAEKVETQPKTTTKKTTKPKKED